MADLTRGHTYGATDQVTNTNLHSLVDAATIANIASADFQLSTTNPIHIGSSAPSDSNSKFWWDTTNNLFLVKDAGGTFQPLGKGLQYTNKSGDSVAAGDVVILDTSNATAVTTTTSAASTDAWGVCATTAANDAVVYVITEGFVPALKVTGATSIGDYLFTSTTAKKADPASSISSGAFARALTSDSASVTAQLLSGGASQTIPSSDLFEIEAGREATVSTTYATPTTVTFDTAFTDPPIVICKPESTTAGDDIVVIAVTTTTFTAFGNAANAFSWVATTPGIFEVKSGVIVQSGTIASGDGASHGSAGVYQTGKTPSIVGSIESTDDSTPGTGQVIVLDRLFGGTTSSSLNFAGRSSTINAFTNPIAAGTCACFLLVSQTGAVQTGNTATAGGAQDTINTLSFEAGTVMECTSLTPTLTFQTAFSAAPAVLVTGEARESITPSNAFAVSNAVASTTVFTARLGSTTDISGFNWIAFEKGHTTLSTAKRLG